MDRREGRLLPEILQKSVEILQFFPKLLVLPVFPVPAAALMEGFFLPALLRIKAVSFFVKPPIEERSTAARGISWLELSMIFRRDRTTCTSLAEK